MPYATIGDIRSILPQLQLTATSRPTEAEVQVYIDITEAELNGVLTSLGHTTPIVQATSPLSFAMAREMVKQKVAAEVLRAQLAGLRDAGPLGAKAFDDAWASKLMRLKDPNDPFTFPDITGTDDQVKMDVVASSMVSEDPEFYENARVTREQSF